MVSTKGFVNGDNDARVTKNHAQFNMMSSQPPLVLVDGSSYLFRAFYALPNLTNAAGEPSGAILGVMNMLRRLRQDYVDSQILVVFDAKGKTFRHELYDQYKANRASMPNELRTQIQPLHDLIRAYGLPLISITGVEADDVIGTMAKRAEQAGQSVVISTGDKDMAQLVSDRIILLDTMKNTQLDCRGVEEKFGVKPGLIIDYLALMGDSSDNIPGVPGVGPKTAAKWLNEYGSLDNLIAHADQIKGKVGDKFRAHIAQLHLAKTLTTIKCDGDLPVGDAIIQESDQEVFVSLLKAWSMTSWLKELTAQAESQPQIRTAYETILTDDQWQRWLDRLQQATCFCFDTETTSLDAMQAELVGLSFCMSSGEACYIPLGHAYPACPDQLPAERVLAALKPVFENATIHKVGQNLKYDLKVLANYGITLQGIYFDTMLASYVLEAGQGRHDMDSLAKRHLNYETTHYEDVAGKGAKQICFSQVPIDSASHYAAEDADITWQLYQLLKARLDDAPSLAAVFFEMEMPLLSVLSTIERDGVIIDSQLLQQQSKALAKKIESLEQEAYQMAAQNFNLSSPKQLQDVLFEKMGLPVLKKTPKGQASTAEDVLTELALTYPLPRVILQHRRLSKLKSTYTDKLPLQVNPNTHRVHTHYHQAVAATGRLSSTDPNLQNIPIKSDDGRAIRQAFIARTGAKLVAADYSQIELRIMAHLSQDPGLLAAFKQGVDIHRATAAEVFALSPQAVTHEQRRRAKAINFGLIYGMSAFGLAKQLGIVREEAQLYRQVYFDRYPGVKNYMDRTREQAQELGYVETLFGRRLYLPQIKAKQAGLRQAAERAAINAPMQGTAADIIKRAMIHVEAWLNEVQLDAKMIMQVHDELVFDVAEKDIDRLVVGIKQQMEQAAQLDVPLLVDVGVSDNWGEAH